MTKPEDTRKRRSDPVVCMNGCGRQTWNTDGYCTACIGDAYLLDQERKRDDFLDGAA